jgi:hypothetical protein
MERASTRTPSEGWRRGRSHTPFSNPRFLKKELQSMIPRSFLPWVALVITLAAPPAYAQCNNGIGLDLMPLAPGCSAPDTPVLSVAHVGVTLEFSIESQHPNSTGELFVGFPRPGNPIVFADCLIHLDGNLIFTSHAFQTNAQGTHTFTSIVPALEPILGMTFVMQAGLIFQGAPINGVSASNAFMATVGCAEGTAPPEGCGPDFWSDEENIGDWPAQYSPTTLFSSVFENAFPGLTLDEVLEQSGTGLNALGRHAVAALLNAATIPTFPLSTAQVITLFNSVFPGGNYAEVTAIFAELNAGNCPFGPSAPQGCSVEFWSNVANNANWPAQYSQNTLFSSVFENAFPGLTLSQVLDLGGPDLEALGRHTVAALLNAATIPSFPLSTAQVIAMFNSVFPGGNYSEVTETFEILNAGVCPFSGPSTPHGCSVDFWSDDENNEDWPAQYSPNTLFSSVFENAFPGLTLDQVLDQTGTGLNALGRQTVAALLNAATIQGFPLSTAQVIAMFNAAFPGGNYVELTATFVELNAGTCPFGGPAPSEGCSHGFWKNHSESWPAQYSPNAQFSSVFENAFPGMSLMDVLEQGGGGLNALGRQLVAALLNAATIEDFPLTTAQIISMFNEVFPGGDYQELKDTLEELNEGDCPFDDPSSSEGCSVDFWSDEENNEDWPAQYTPNTLFSSVFDNAFPGLTLGQVLDQSGTGLNALGRQVVAALLNAATIQDFELTTAEVISMFNAAFPGGNYAELTVTLLELNSGDCPFDDPPEGCSVNFWSDEENNEHWPAQYTPNTLFSSVFENAFPGLTLGQVLDQSGTGLNALGRQVVAALLNAATIQNFPLTTAQVIAMFNAVFPGGNYEELMVTLLELNSADCPFGGPAPSEGCGQGFWKNHSDAWPAQYSSSAQFSSVFENAFQGMSLMEVLEQGGGGLNALGRQLVAALLNAATIEEFPLTTAQIISMFNEVFPGGDYEELKDTLEALNSGDCPF